MSNKYNLNYNKIIHYNNFEQRNSQKSNELVDTKSFLKKFANRCEKIDRKGIFGIVNSSRVQIEKVKTYKTRKKNLSLSLPVIGNKRYDRNDIGKSIGNRRYDNIQVSDSYNINKKMNNNNKNSVLNSSPNHKYHLSSSLSPRNIRNLNNNPSSILRPSKSTNNYQNNYYQNNYQNIQSYNNNYNNYNSYNYNSYNYLNNNNYFTRNNDEIFLERDYVPCTYKEYKEEMSEYKKQKFGGLGAEIGSKEWKIKDKNFKKKLQYGSEIINNLKGICGYKESPEIERMNNLEKNYLDSAKFRAQKYGECLKKLKQVKDLKEAVIKSNRNKLQNDYYEVERIMQNLNDNKEENAYNNNYYIGMEENNKANLQLSMNKLRESLIDGVN